MLEVTSLVIAYEGTRVVDGIDLSLGDGGSLALLGPNGAGNTSPLWAISSLVPYEGSIVFDGRDLRTVPPDKVAKSGLIHIPEGRRVFGTLTVHENLQVGLTARAGRTGGYSLLDVYDLLPALVPLRRRPGWALSGGEQQMVALGRALVAAPRLLLLDEPSLGLAPRVTQEVFAALREIDVPMLLVEQNSTAALEICDSACVLVQGEIVLRGDSAELGDREALIDSYLGHRSLEAVED